MASTTVYAHHAKSGTSSYNSSYVFVGQGTNGYWACLGFDLSFLANAAIHSFKLYLNSATSSQSNLTQAVTFRASDTTVWNAPFIVGAAATSTKMSGSTRAYVWDLSSKKDLLAALVGLGAGAYMHLVETGGTRQMQYEGLAGGTSGPRIEVVYTLNRSTFVLDKQSVNAGSAINMTISPADNTYTHEVTWSFGSHTQVQALAAGVTGTGLTIPQGWLDAIPNAQSGTASATLRTYQDGVEIGSMTAQFTIAAPQSVVPTITSLSIVRVNGDVPSGWGIYVQGKSKATLTVNGAAGAYGSSIASYSISGGGYSAAAPSFTTGFLMSPGLTTFTAIVTDTRGRTATAEATVMVYEYSGPRFTGLTVGRCDGQGRAATVGEYLRILPTFAYSAIGGNSITCSVRYRQGTSAPLGAPIMLTSGAVAVIGGGTISAEHAYQAVFTLADAFVTVTRVETIPSAQYSIFYRADGGVSVGTAEGVGKCLYVNPVWPAYIGGRNLAQLDPAMIGAAEDEHTHGLGGTELTGILPLDRLGTSATPAVALALLNALGMDIRKGHTGMLTTTSATGISFSSEMMGQPVVLVSQNSGSNTTAKITGVTATGFAISPGTSNVAFNYLALYWGN